MCLIRVPIEEAKPCTISRPALARVSPEINEAYAIPALALIFSKPFSQAVIKLSLKNF